MLSLGVVERSWDEEDGNMQQQYQQQQQFLSHPNRAVEAEMGQDAGITFTEEIPRGFVGVGDKRRSQFLAGNTPQPQQQQQATSMACSRYSPMDFELLLHEGKQPTDDMRRSLAYMKWYNSKRLHNSRLLPPLCDIRHSIKDPLETPWENMPATRMSNAVGMPGGGAADSGKVKFCLELDAKNLQQAHEQQCFNPYAAGFQQREDNVLSPGTQFFGAYAPTPVATLSTPNTLRAYAHSHMVMQDCGGNARETDVSQPIHQMATQPVYTTEWNAAGDFRQEANAISNMSQQYYTQEPINPFDYYHDTTITGYYNAGMAGMPDPARMQPAFMAVSQPAETTVARGGGGGGRGRRGGGSGRGRGRYGGSKSSGRGNAYRESFPVCSEVLERFRVDVMNSKAAHWRIGNIIGYSVEFAQDQEGSRFIQRAVDTAASAEVDALFREIFHSPLDLVTDIFGNYVLQKLLEIGNEQQLEYAATRLQNNVVSLTLQTYGCRVIQKCIEVMPPRGLDIILAELEGNVAKCIQDQNGNHVVQKCVEIIPERCGFIVSAFSGRVMELATHAYGCRVIQCIMEHCPDQEETIFWELLQCVGTLAKNQYGNYVIQHVLQHMKDETKVSHVFKSLKDDFYEFSKQKFASNVMEKMFIRANPQQRMEIIEMLCSPMKNANGELVEVLSFKRLPPVKKEVTEKQRAGEHVKKGRRDRERERERESAAGAPTDVQIAGKESPSMLCLMMQNPFANYVAQRVMDAADVEQFWCLVDNIQKFLLPISTYTYGAPIVQRLVRRELVKVPEDVVIDFPAAPKNLPSGKGNHGRHRKDTNEHNGGD